MQNRFILTKNLFWKSFERSSQPLSQTLIKRYTNMGKFIFLLAWCSVSLHSVLLLAEGLNVQSRLKEKLLQRDQQQAPTSSPSTAGLQFTTIIVPQFSFKPTSLPRTSLASGVDYPYPDSQEDPTVEASYSSCGGINGIYPNNILDEILLDNPDLGMSNLQGPCYGPAISNGPYVTIDCFQCSLSVSPAAGCDIGAAVCYQCPAAYGTSTVNSGFNMCLH